MMFVVLVIFLLLKQCLKPLLVFIKVIFRKNYLLVNLRSRLRVFFTSTSSLQHELCLPEGD
jgi:hypothetical protein